MERIQSVTVAALLALALLATACSGDEGEDGRLGEPTTTPAPTTSSTPTTTTSLPPVVGVDEVLGTQAVQDFAIHLDLWKLDVDGAPVDLYEPLLERAAETAVDEQVLAGGFTVSMVEGLDASLIGSDGAPVPSVSVDFGLLGAPRGSVSAVRDELGRAIETAADGDFVVGSADAESAVALVEILTADFGRARTHVAPGDRSAIDLTFLDDLQPGDDVGMYYLFGQTLPGDPAAEAGLSPLELFGYRWDNGLLRIHGDGGVPWPMRGTSIDVREGSTMLTRDQKRELAQAAGIAAALDPIPELYQERLTFEPTEEPARRGSRRYQARLELAVPGTNDHIDVLVEGSGLSDAGPDPAPRDIEVYRVTIRAPFVRPVSFGGSSPLDRAASGIAMLRLLLTCAATATQLQAYNEAHRRPDRLTAVFNQFPTTRFLPGDEDAGDESETLDAESPADDAPPDSDEPEEPPLGCDEPAEDLPFPPFPKGGMAYGDVHITTMDGTHYTNNAAGEFLLYEDAAVTVQMRLEPWSTGRLGVSVATAAAIELDGHAVSLHLDGSAWIDGEPAEFVRGETRSVGAGEITWWSDGWVIVAPGGTLVRVDENVFSFVIRVNPAADTAPVGLLGDLDDDRTNDLVLRDGTPWDGHPTRDYERLYAEFIESWRLTQQESLFHYAAGESTESFTIDGFPTDRAVIDELTAEERAMGEEACATAGVTDRELLDACIVDVAVTGEPAFALDSFDAQILAIERELASIEPEPDDVSARAPGDTLLVIGDETLVFGTDPPNQRPQGIQASWNCQIIDGDLFADGSIDLADGPRYSLTVRYLEAENRLTLLLETPNEEGLTRAYAWVETLAPHFADAVDTLTLADQRLSVRGELYVNETLERGFGPASVLPDGATFDPFSLELDCVS